MIWLLWLILLFSSPAHAQCDGVFSGNTVCGNASNVPGPPAQSLLTTIIPSVTLYTSFYNASGSNQTTTGTINSSSTSLTLAAAKDFQNGEGIIVNHAGATFATNAPTALSVTPTGATGATTYTYQIASIDATGGVGIAITGVSTTTGVASLTNTHYNALSWSAPASGPTPGGYAVYRTGVGLIGIAPGTSFNDYGNAIDVTQPFWLPTAVVTGTALNDWLQTTISSGGGTTSLTLANAASQNVSSATVVHDDSAAINTAILALPASGGTIVLTGLSGNTFNICCEVAIGNGTSSAFSTRSGVKLTGIIKPPGIINFSEPSVGSTLWNETGTLGHLKLAGPLEGFEVDNIFFSCNDLFIGLFVQSASEGSGRDLMFSNCMTAGLYMMTYAAGGFTPSSLNADNLHDYWTNIQVVLPQRGTSVDGILVGGVSDATHDTDFNTFTNVEVLGFGEATQVCIDLQDNDSNVFIDIHCIQPQILFNYCVNNGFPNTNFFYLVDATFANSCSPSIGNAPNRIFGMGTANTNTCPINLAGLLCNGEEWISTPGCSNTGGVLTDCTTTITWPTPFSDTNYFPFCELVDVTASHPMIVGSITRTSTTQSVVDQFSTVSGSTSGTLVCHAYHQ